MAVGALNPDGTAALFSNDGPWVRAWRPGAAIVSTLPVTFDGGQQASSRVAADGRRRRAVDDRPGQLRVRLRDLVRHVLRRADPGRRPRPAAASTTPRGPRTSAATASEPGSRPAGARCGPRSRGSRTRAEPGPRPGGRGPRRPRDPPPRRGARARLRRPLRPQPPPGGPCARAGGAGAGHRRGAAGPRPAARAAVEHGVRGRRPGAAAGPRWRRPPRSRSRCAPTTSPSSSTRRSACRRCAAAPWRRRWRTSPPRSRCCATAPTSTRSRCC